MKRYFLFLCIPILLLSCRTYQDEEDDTYSLGYYHSRGQYLDTGGCMFIDEYPPIDSGETTNTRPKLTERRLRNMVDRYVEKEMNERERRGK